MAKQRKKSKPAGQKTKQKVANKNRFKKGNNKQRQKDRNKSLPKSKDHGVQNRRAEDDEASEAGSDDLGREMLEMMEEEDVAYLKEQNGFAQWKSGKKATKRKSEDIKDDTEQKYEQHLESRLKLEGATKKMRLPIKTARGLELVQEDEEEQSIEEEADESESEAESEKSSTEEVQEEKITVPPNAAELYLQRKETLEEKKLQIGKLASGFLEEPQQRVKRLESLLEFLEDSDPGVCLTVKKLGMAALLEVFKDVLPTYRIKHPNQSNTKLKKTTAQVWDYENSLLKYYKLYLQGLEKIIFANLKPKRGDSRKIQETEKRLGEFALRCMCVLLESHPEFNFSLNVIQLLVPFLDHPAEGVRTTLRVTLHRIFREDKRGNLSLQIVRKINQLVKRKGHQLRRDVLDVLLGLRIQSVDLEKEKREQMEGKKRLTHKERMMHLSRKERKREKLRSELDRELLEAQAEESKQTKHKYLTDITKLVFAMYFRVLKSSPKSQLMSAVLEGLAKFAHCINLDFFQDLIVLLHQLMDSGSLGHRECLNCIKTVFTILSGHGEALNIDPLRFYSLLYKNLLCLHSGKTNEDIPLAMECLESALVKRRKKVSIQRVLAFTKRLCTVALQPLHNGTIACLAMLSTILLTHRKADVLLDTDTSSGSGVFLPELEEPEHCNASSTVLWELTLLKRHYHPVVRQYAQSTLNGKSLEGNRRTPAEFFSDYDSSQMAFRPAVPPPKRPKTKLKQ